MLQIYYYKSTRWVQPCYLLTREAYKKYLEVTLCIRAELARWGMKYPVRLNRPIRCMTRVPPVQSVLLNYEGAWKHLIFYKFEYGIPILVMYLHTFSGNLWVLLLSHMKLLWTSIPNYNTRNKNELAGLGSHLRKITNPFKRITASIRMRLKI